MDDDHHILDIVHRIHDHAGLAGPVTGNGVADRVLVLLGIGNNGREYKIPVCRILDVIAHYRLRNDAGLIQVDCAVILEFQAVGIVRNHEIIEEEVEFVVNIILL